MYFSPLHVKWRCNEVLRIITREEQGSERVACDGDEGGWKHRNMHMYFFLMVFTFALDLIVKQLIPFTLSTELTVRATLLVFHYYFRGKHCTCLFIWEPQLAVGFHQLNKQKISNTRLVKVHFLNCRIAAFTKRCVDVFQNVITIKILIGCMFKMKQEGLVTSLLLHFTVSSSLFSRSVSARRVFQS